MARRKSTAQPVPQTTEEAVALIGDYARCEHMIAAAELLAEAVIADAKAQRDSAIARIEAEQKPRFLALKAWWEANQAKVSPNARSAEIGGAKIGIRLSPPKLKLPKGKKSDAVIALLRALPARMGYAVMRVKYEIDKPAIISLLRRPPENDGLPDRLKAAGFVVDQVNEFFIDTKADGDAPRAAGKTTGD